MKEWYKEAMFYHIYPLGFCGAPKNNNYVTHPVHRLKIVEEWIEHIKSLGSNAVYFGPIFESVSHGYDTVDYFNIDRRLGNNQTFLELVKLFHSNKIRVVIDGVFNHVGRDFWAFKDVLINGQASKYCTWFSNLRFGEKSPYGDPFIYDTWNGYYNLVKLDLNHPEVRNHIFDAIKLWISNFDIDGLRLDCADRLDFDFLRALNRICKNIKSDFWLMGEVLHGDYSRWINNYTIDSVTNYECYKGLYSSHNDINLFEIAYSLNRQFNDANGLYKGLYLYAFADNHDVDRVATSLKNQAHLYTLYALLFTMPGIPSIYYGSEWGIEGRKINDMDEELRPKLDLNDTSRNSRNRDLVTVLSTFAKIRKHSDALKHGGYKQLLVKHEQFAFARIADNECIIIFINSSSQTVSVILDIPVSGSKLIDLVNKYESFAVNNSRSHISYCYPYWVRILKVIP